MKKIILLMCIAINVYSSNLTVTIPCTQVILTNLVIITNTHNITNRITHIPETNYTFTIPKIPLLEIQTNKYIGTNWYDFKYNLPSIQVFKAFIPKTMFFIIPDRSLSDLRFRILQYDIIVTYHKLHRELCQTNLITGQVYSMYAGKSYCRECRQQVDSQIWYKEHPATTNISLMSNISRRLLPNILDTGFENRIQVRLIHWGNNTALTQYSKRTNVYYIDKEIPE